MLSRALSVSLVIPNYNGRALLRQHLPAVLASANGAEIIVVDDASTDDSVALLEEKFPEVKIVKHPKNRRFAAACNSGVAAAGGEIVVLLNSDVSPQKDFLDPLVAHFADQKVFAVGCLEIQPEGKKAGRSGADFKRGLMVHWRSNNQETGPTAWVAGGSGAFRKSMWEELNGMDTLFRPAYEEDRDICYRAMKRGWQVEFEAKSVVHHHHESTNTSALGRQKMTIASYKNHLLFVWKNITNWRLFGIHLMWLPYHLTITSIRSKGLFLIGFFQALGQLIEVLPKRNHEASEGRVSDGEIIAKIKSLA